MSTKCTIACGNPKKTDFHLYFDYADHEYHLDFYGEKASTLIIPKDAMEAIVAELGRKGFTLPGNLDYLEQLFGEKDDLT
jgi:hypothetical protein